MLKTTKTITLNGTSEIGGKAVANMTANITDDANINISTYITNTELYAENKTLVRKDIAEFTDLAYSLQDETTVE